MITIIIIIIIIISNSSSTSSSSSINITLSGDQSSLVLICYYFHCLFKHILYCVYGTCMHAIIMQKAIKMYLPSYKMPKSKGNNCSTK